MTTATILACAGCGTEISVARPWSHSGMCTACRHHQWWLANGEREMQRRRDHKAGVPIPYTGKSGKNPEAHALLMYNPDLDDKEPRMIPNSSAPDWDPYEKPATLASVRHHLAAIWGPPSQHRCHWCRAEAQGYIYDYSDPAGERVDEKFGLLYSPDPANYQPACIRCSRELRAKQKGSWSDDDPESQKQATWKTPPPTMVDGCDPGTGSGSVG